MKYAYDNGYETKHTATLKSRYNFLESSISFSNSLLEHPLPYIYLGDNSTNTNLFKLTEFSADVRFAFGENSVWFMGSRLPTLTRFPILSLSYTKGFDNVFNGEFNYQKIKIYQTS